MICILDVPRHWVICIKRPEILCLQSVTLRRVSFCTSTTYRRRQEAERAWGLFQPGLEKKQDGGEQSETQEDAASHVEA